MRKRKPLTAEEESVEEAKRKELRRIRKKFMAGFKQFGLVFIGRSYSSMRAYETGENGRRIPDSVLRLAHVWEKFLDDMTTNRNDI